jgi:hypothetical protein
MPFPTKVDTGNGIIRNFAAADDLEIDDIVRRAASGNMTIGSNLVATQELVLGSATSDVRVLGDMLIDGSETVSTDETVVGTFNANGNVNLGNNSGDTVNLGGGTSDIINLEADLVLGAGIVNIGASVTDYLGELWLDAVNTNGPALAAYDLNASGTNAGAYAIGVDPSLLANATATDLMTALDEIDAALSATSSTLQEAYAAGNTIDVTAANGIVTFRNNTTSDTTTVFTVDKTPGASTGGIAMAITVGANSTGAALDITNLGSGDLVVFKDGATQAFKIQGDGSIQLNSGASGTVDITSGDELNITAQADTLIDVTSGPLTLSTTTSGALTINSAGILDIDAAGNLTMNTASTFTMTFVTADSNMTLTSGSELNLTSAIASTYQVTSGNMNLDALSGNINLTASAEIQFDDAGIAKTFSQAADRDFDLTAAGEVLNGATSVVGAINRIARAISDDGQLLGERPIENGVTIAAGDIIAASTTAGRVTQNNENAEAVTAIIGVALTGGTGDVGGTVFCRFFLPGSIVTDSGATFTSQSALFAPDGTGRATHTAPADPGDRVTRVGYAISATEYVFQPVEGFAL